MKKGFIQIMLANMITLIASILTNFLLPKYLSVESYANIKLYTLCISYAGFLHFGYNDGMYLKYGGMNLTDIDKRDFGKNFFNCFVLEIIITTLMLIIGIIIRDIIIIAFSFGFLSINLLGYIKLFYQAVGEFKSYGRSLNFEKVSIFIINIVLLFLFKTNNSYIYIWAQVLSGTLICLYLIIKLNSKLHFLRYACISLNEIKYNIKNGLVLMLGNFSSGIFSGLDRWFVKILLYIKDFAIYSFAANMENIVVVFTAPITISMYNYLCKEHELEDIKKIKNISLLWAILIISIAYPAKFVLEHYLPNYLDANNIVFLLFSAQVFNTIIKAIYVNIYKSEKKQKKYFIQMISMIILGFILNTIFINIAKNNFSVAIATVITNFVWLLICEFDKNNKLKFKLKEYIYIFIILSIYIYTGYFMNSILGLLSYLLFVIILSMIFMPNTLKYLYDITKIYIKNKRGKQII